MDWQPVGQEGWILMEFSLDKKLRRRIDELLRSNIHAKLQKRLFALLWMDEGKSIEEVAALLRLTTRCVRNWLRIFRKKGFDALLILHYTGYAENLRQAEVAE